MDDDDDFDGGCLRWAWVMPLSAMPVRMAFWGSSISAARAISGAVFYHALAAFSKAGAIA